MKQIKRKRSAAGTAERKTTKVVVRSDSYIVSQFLRALKWQLLMMGSILFFLLAVWMLVAPIEPGGISWSMGAALSIVSGFIGRVCYEEAWR